MSRWLPQGLPPWVAEFARALEKQFAPRLPLDPARLPAIAQADLTDAHAARNPYGVCINTDKGALAVSVLVAGVWTWRDWDGTAL